MYVFMCICALNAAGCCESLHCRPQSLRSHLHTHAHTDRRICTFQLFYFSTCVLFSYSCCSYKLQFAEEANKAIRLRITFRIACTCDRYIAVIWNAGCSYFLLKYLYSPGQLQPLMSNEYQ